MNEKPGLEPGFFLLDELLAARRATRCSRCRGHACRATSGLV